MKALKIIGIILGVLVAIIVVLTLIAPSEFVAERSVVINAPKEIVFDHVKYWRNWKSWSPWAEMDPSMKVTIEGKDGESGSKYVWTGDPELTGSGEMTNTGIKESEEIAFHLHFKVPYESESEGYVRLSEVDGGTEVAWGFYGEPTFPFNVMLIFQSMEEMMQKDFDRGLELMKNNCEKEYATIQQYEIKQVEFKPKKFIAIQKEVAFDGIQEFFAQSFGTIQQVSSKKRVRQAGAPSGLYYSWDEQNKVTDLAAAIPVKRTFDEGEVKTIKIDRSTAFMVDYFGPYEQLANAHKALNFHLVKNNLKSKPPVIEEYITDPGAEPDSKKWLTKVYWLAE